MPEKTEGGLSADDGAINAESKFLKAEAGCRSGWVE